MVRALASHARGHRFEFCSLHQSNIIRTCSPSGTGSGLLFIWTISAHRESGSRPIWMGAAPFMYALVLSSASMPHMLLVPLNWHNRLALAGADTGPCSQSQNQVWQSVHQLPPLGLPGSMYTPPFRGFQRCALRGVIALGAAVAAARLILYFSLPWSAVHIWSHSQPLRQILFRATEYRLLRFLRLLHPVRHFRR